MIAHLTLASRYKNIIHYSVIPSTIFRFSDAKCFASLMILGVFQLYLKITQPIKDLEILADKQTFLIKH